MSRGAGRTLATYGARGAEGVSIACRHAHDALLVTRESAAHLSATARPVMGSVKEVVKRKNSFPFLVRPRICAGF